MSKTSQDIQSVVTEKVGIVQEYSEKFLDWLKVFIPNLIFATIVLIIGLWLIKKISRLAVKAMERREIEVSLRTFFKSLIGIGLKIILFILVAGMLGVQTASFVAILGAAGLAVGLALQGSLSNFAGGVLILIFKPYKVGDFIETINQKGKVKEIQIFNTILETPEYKTIILPNGPVSNSFIVNHTKNGILRVDIDLKIDKEHPIELVKDLLIKHALIDNRIASNPPTRLFFSDYCNGGYIISIRLVTNTDDHQDLRSDLLEVIKSTFDYHQIHGPKEV
jgi:small conductance mechanosensitive channel